MDNEEFVCPKCDEECHSNGHWQNVTLWYCPTCDMEFEVILERSAFISTRPASASTDSAEARRADMDVWTPYGHENESIVTLKVINSQFNAYCELIEMLPKTIMYFPQSVDASFYMIEILLTEMWEVPRGYDAKWMVMALCVWAFDKALGRNQRENIPDYHGIPRERIRPVYRVDADVNPFIE